MVKIDYVHHVMSTTFEAMTLHEQIWYKCQTAFYFALQKIICFCKSSEGILLIAIICMIGYFTGQYYHREKIDAYDALHGTLHTLSLQNTVMK